VAVRPLVFLGLSLATGLGLVDSMLYSTRVGLIVIVFAAMIWSIPGASPGSVIGFALSAHSEV